MNAISIKLQTPWEEVKERMKENDLRLTDADLMYEPGHEEELLIRLEKIMNKTRPEVIAYIESISANEGLAG
ncbi:MAG: general stress protein CsbD [Bacteroidetes bacterium]|nr:MAG: general stress protein CsbD [Bacteroidota bacterium]